MWTFALAAGCSGGPADVGPTGGDGGKAGGDGDGGDGGNGGTTGTPTPQPCAVFTVDGVPLEHLPLLVDPIDGPLADRALRSRVVAFTGGAGTLQIEGALTAADASGSALASLAGDGILVLRATAAGAGTVTASGDSCVAASFSTSALSDPGLSGRAVTSAPGWSPVDAFHDGEIVLVGLDPVRLPDRVEATFEVHLVAHRPMAEWLADPTITPVTTAVGRLADAGVTVVELDLAARDPDPTLLAVPYDIAVDFNGNLQLDAGELLDGGDAPGLYVVADLTTPGPHATTSEDWSSSYWITQRVYWPEDIDTLGALPLIVISHGNGHRYDWYDYLGEHFASWGYVVMSHRNDTAPGTITAAITTVNNTEALLADPSVVDDGVLTGHIDSHRIGWIGHSRGGEGVVIAYDAVFDGAAPVTAFSASDVLVVSSIAPVVFEDPLDLSNPHEAVYHTLAGSRDGDVTGSVNNGDVQWYRMHGNALNDRVVTYVHGADHNDFNCCGADDWQWGTTGDGEIVGRQAAQGVAKSALLALMEVHLKDNAGLAEHLWRDPAAFRSPSVTPVVAGSMVPATWADQIVIDDFQAEGDSAISSSGAAVTVAVAEYAEGAMDDDDTSFTWEGDDPFNGFTQSSNDTNPQRGASVEWSAAAPGSIGWETPVRDISAYRWVSLRAAQVPRHDATLLLDAPLSFGLVLIDGTGRSATVDTADFGAIPAPYHRSNDGSGTGWAAEFAHIRVPLSHFDGVGGVDLTDVVELRLEFGSIGTSDGRVGLDDLAFIR
jgi:hypothetical protein